MSNKTMQQETPQKIEITLEDILNVNQKGFERVQSQMSEMENRLTKRMDILEKVDSKIDGHTNRIEKLEDSNRVIRTKLAI